MSKAILTFKLKDNSDLALELDNNTCEIVIMDGAGRGPENDQKVMTISENESNFTLDNFWKLYSEKIKETGINKIILVVDENPPVAITNITGIFYQYMVFVATRSSLFPKQIVVHYNGGGQEE